MIRTNVFFSWRTIYKNLKFIENNFSQSFCFFSYACNIFKLNKYGRNLLDFCITLQYIILYNKMYASPCGLWFYLFKLRLNAIAHKRGNKVNNYYSYCEWNIMANIDIILIFLTFYGCDKKIYKYLEKHFFTIIIFLPGILCSN